MRKILFVLLCFISFGLTGQSIILLENASFEGAETGYSTIPDGWTDCGFEGESPPDLFKGSGIHFGLSRKAKDGDNGVCLISRIDNTWEGLGQKLPYALEKGKAHFLHLYAMRSPEYLATDRLTGDKENFNKALQLYLWGSKEACESKALLGVSQLIENEYWEKINFAFIPDDSYQFLWFEVRYQANATDPYRGNMLVDHFSPINVWTDTIRYRAYCIENEFVGFVDNNAMDEKALEKLARNYLAQILESKQYSGWSIANMIAIEMLNDFQDKVKINGLRQFLLTERPTSLRAVLNAFEKVGAEDHLELISKGIRVILNNREGTLTSTQNELFDTLDERYLELPNLDQLKYEYIKDNKEAILSEMQRCQ